MAGEIKLSAEEVLKIHVQCEDSMDVKDSRDGYLAVIPIVSGTFEGKIGGKIVPGGADWSTRQKNGAHVFAKYLLQADNGEYIAVENEGFLGNGQDPCIKTVPKFKADENGAYAWLNYGVYVGKLEAGEKPWQVEITVFRLN